MLVEKVFFEAAVPIRSVHDGDGVALMDRLQGTRYYQRENKTQRLRWLSDQEDANVPPKV